MVSQGRLTEQAQVLLEDIRARLVSVEKRLNGRDDIRFYVLLGTMVAVMITMWVTIMLAILLRT